MLRNKQLPAFNGIPGSLASGGTVTATCKLTLGERVHVLWLLIGNDGATNPGQGIGTLAANGMIGEIRMLINGKVQRRHTATQLNEINRTQGNNNTQFAAKTSGTAGVAGFRTMLPIFLAEPWRNYAQTNLKTGRAVPEAEQGAWNLNSDSNTVVQTVTIEVDLVGRTSAGASAVLDGPVLQGFYEYDYDNTSGIGAIMKWISKNQGANSTPGEITDLPKTLGSYQAISLFTVSDHTYVTQVMFTRNNEQIRQDMTRSENDAILISREMSPTALDTTSNATKDNTGIFHIVLDYDDPVSSLMPVGGVNELTLKPTFSAAPNGLMPIILQIAGYPD